MLSVLPNWGAAHMFREERQTSKKLLLRPRGALGFCPLGPTGLRVTVKHQVTRTKHLMTGLFWASWSRTFSAVPIQTPVLGQGPHWAPLFGLLPPRAPRPCRNAPLLMEPGICKQLRHTCTQSISQKINLLQLTPGCTVTK